MSKSFSRWVTLVLILWLAFALRLYRLDAQELWGDESVSVGARRLSVAQVLLGKTDVHPPLYFFTLREAMLLAGVSVFSIRSVSTFCGVLIVPLVYRIGKRTLSETVGKLSALIAAVSALQVFYSQEARMYTMATAWSAASLWCTIEILRRPHPGRGWWVTFIITALLGMYTHYFVAFVTIAEGLALLWAARHNRRLLARLAIATVAIAALYAPWISIQRQYASSQAYARWDVLTPAVLAEIVRQTLTSWSVVVYNVRPTQSFPSADWGAVIAVALALVGAIAAVRSRRIEAMLLPPCVILVLVLGWAVNPILPVFQDRYLMIGTPAYLVLIGAGLKQISNLNPPKERGAGSQASKVLLITGIVAVIAPQVLALHAWFTDPAFVKGEYGRAMQLVSQQAQPDDILLLNNYMQWSLFDYYRPNNITVHLVPADALLSEDQTDAAMTKLATGRARAWLLEFGHPEQYDPQHRAERWLAQHGYKQFARDFAGFRLNLYLLGAPPSDVPAHRLDAQLGESILLEGYTLANDPVRPGDSLLLTLFWKAPSPVKARYTVFAHLADSTGKPAAQTDSQPLGGTAPTDTWQVGVTLADHYAIALPSNLPPGQYELRVGMYIWPDLVRLPVILNGKPAGDYVPLTAVQVTR